MTHSRIDRIMKKVEEFYRGDFLVNGDWEFSQNLAKKYRAQYANRYNGKNGTFETGRMFCTEACNREGDTIKIPNSGIVFGPYFAFPAGDYVAVYDISGDLHNCEVEVSSQAVGCIASGCAEDFQRNGNVVLPFTLTIDLLDLELKTINNGSGEITFKKVSVSDYMESVQEENTVQPAESERETVSQSDGVEEAATSIVYGTYIHELLDMQGSSTTAYLGLQVAAECTLPQRTRFHAIKLFIRKLVNCFITFQLDFNRRVVAIFGDQNHQLQILAASIMEERAETQRIFSQKIEQMNRIIAMQNDKINKLQERVNVFEAAHREQKVSYEDEERLEFLENELSSLESQLSSLTDMFGDFNLSAERLAKAESDLQIMEETVGGLCADDTRIEEIGRLWSRIEDVIKLLHECAAVKKSNSHVGLGISDQ